MSRKRKSLDTLEELLKKTDTKAEFNIVEDLESLVRMHGVLRSKKYREKLNAVLEKYKNAELTAVRNTVVNESIKGNMQAVKLYAEYFKPADIVAADDGLIDVIKQSSKEVFPDEQ